MSRLMNKMVEKVKAMAGCAGKYLTFSLAEEQYGIGILSLIFVCCLLGMRRIPGISLYSGRNSQ